MTVFWTDADDAELDVLVHALVLDYFEHRKHCAACKPGPCREFEAWRTHNASCRACQDDAPLTFGPACRDWRERRLGHGRSCARCNPCSRLQAAVGEIVAWRVARVLFSRAQALRAARKEAT